MLAHRIVGFERELTSARRAPRRTDVGAGPRAERKIERADEHRLTRARFAGEDRRAVGKLDLGTLDQAVTLDLELPQHTTAGP